MRSSSLSSACLLAAVILTANAFGTPFSFSYRFGTDTGFGLPLFTGTFNGDRNGDVVTNISDFAFAVDGVPQTPLATPQFFLGNFDPSNGWGAAPVISFQLAHNNFGISDDGPTGAPLVFFYLVPTDMGALGQSIDPSVSVSDGPSYLGEWQLTDLSAPVPTPDSGGTAEPLLLTLAALGLLRRFRRA